MLWTRGALIVAVTGVLAACSSGSTAGPDTSPPEDASPAALVDELDAGGAAWAMAKSDGALWVQVDPPVDAIVRIDVESGTAVPQVPGGHQVEWAGGAAKLCADPAGLVVAFDSAWLACKEGKVLRMAIPGGAVTPITTEPGSHTFAVTDAAVWVTNYRAGSVSRIDARTNVVTTVPGVGSGGGITSGDRYVWAAADEGIAMIDPETASVVETVDLGTGYGSNLYELVWDDGIIWASTRSSQVLKVDPSR